MVMYNNSIDSNVIKLTTKTNEGLLPFALYLKIGNEKKYISDLVTNPNNVLSCMNEVIENQNLYLGIESHYEEFEVKIIWDKNIHDLDDNHEVHTLSSFKNEVELFDFRHNTPYPWSIGYYLFEVQYNGKKYYGGFSVLPKNFSEKQFYKIHEFLNEKLEGITNDLLNFNSISKYDRDFIQEIPSLIFFRWYLLIEKQLFSALNMILQDTDSDRKFNYCIENVPRHIDRKSIIWKSTIKGQLYQNKALNRKYFSNVDTKNNQIVKKRLIEIIKRLEVAKKELTSEIKKIDNELQKSKIFFKEIKEIFESIQNNKTVSNSYKKRLENDKKVEEQKIDRLKDKLQILLVENQKIEYSLKKLNSVLSNEFWMSISHYKAQGPIQSLRRCYLMFEQIYNKFKQFEIGNKKDYQISPAFKPTSILYEYYVYFVAIDCLLSLGFEFPKNYDLKKQLLSTYYKEGLVDGTSVKLTSSNQGLIIYAVFNEEVETSSELALKKEKSFFTNQFNKKPDIKLDLYIQTEELEEFASSFIFETKYRPLHNIYQEKGATNAMIQMENYRAINYVRADGRKKRSIVKDVICVYPGTNEVDIFFETDYGAFLQLFPNGSNTIVGFEEMKKLLSDWISEIRE